MLDDNRIVLRSASGNDREGIEATFARELAPRTPNPALIHDCIARYPSQIAIFGHELAGFVYCRPATPDCLEIVNLLVASHWRNNRLGEKLLRAVENRAEYLGYQAAVLYNSFAYRSHTKRSAAAFYLRCGYQQLPITPATTYYWKSLHRT